MNVEKHQKVMCGKMSNNNNNKKFLFNVTCVNVVHNTTKNNLNMTQKYLECDKIY